MPGTPKPMRLGERERLIATVKKCAFAYGFTQAETDEAVRLALADHEAALECFSSIARFFQDTAKGGRNG